MKSRDWGLGSGERRIVAPSLARARTTRLPLCSHSLFPIPHSRISGFTLVELLVVLVIIGLAGTAVVLTAPGGGDTLARDADKLAARLLRAREEAVLAGRGVQVRVSAAGYDYLRQDFDAWRPLHEGPFRPARFADGTRAQLPASGAQAHVTFDFDPIGGNRPQAVVLEHLERRVRIAIDATGEVSVDAVR
jgi:general secretion pathway protein H